MWVHDIGVHAIALGRPLEAERYAPARECCPVAEQIEVDGELYDAFPLNLSKGGERLALSDTKGNFYVVKNAAAVNITKKEQTSPNDKTRAPQTGNFATAWIDHGRAPKQAAYEYAVYIQPTNKEITRLIKKDGYEVLRRTTRPTS